MKATNDSIPAMLAKIDDTSVKKKNQEEKLTNISLKLSTYENHITSETSSY